jgi:large subunit ribosomal protein L18
MSTAVLEKNRRRERRRARVRGKVRGSAQCPRLSVYRSNRGLVAQLIDDDRGHTLVAAHWTEQELRPLGSMEKATRVGELIADRARAGGIETCVFDRGGYKYHGLVRALAEGARSGGLRF